MRSPFVSLLKAIAALLFLNPAVAFPHDNPIHVVDTITERIQKSHATPRLLIARAYEYRSLGEWRYALADYRAALELDPLSTSALTGLAETLLDSGAPAEAEQAAELALALQTSAETRAPFHALKARSFEKRERWEKALEQWTHALASSRPEIDWFIGQSSCLARLGRAEERVDALTDARKRNPSVVLDQLWIEALVEAGELDTASQEIEPRLQKSRWKSAWLLLRADVRQQQGLAHDAREDARTALAEIQTRLHPQRPDPHLVQEAAKAHTFLDDPEAARHRSP